MTPSRASINHWLAQRIPGAQLDEAGVAAIRRDDDSVVVIEVPANSELCHLCALVAPLPEVAREAALLAALELNRFGRPLGGCWLAWEDDVQMLTLCHNLHVPGADAIAFGNTLDNFLIALDHARALLLTPATMGGGDTGSDTDAERGDPSGAAGYRNQEAFFSALRG